MSTTGADRIMTAQWIFAAMASSPHIAPFFSIPPERKVELDKKFAKLLSRIVGKDCIDQMRPLAAADLETAFGQAGEALGVIAMQELMGDPAVEKGLSSYVEYLTDDDFKALVESLPDDQSK